MSQSDLCGRINSIRESLKCLFGFQDVPFEHEVQPLENTSHHWVDLLSLGRPLMRLALSARIGFGLPNTDDMFVVHLMDSGGPRAACVRSVGQASFEVHSPPWSCTMHSSERQMHPESSVFVQCRMMRRALMRAYCTCWCEQLYPGPVLFRLFDKSRSLSTVQSSSHASTHLPTCTFHGQTSDTDQMVHEHVHVLHGVWCSECRREYGVGDFTDPHVAQCRDCFFLTCWLSSLQIPNSPE